MAKLEIIVSESVNGVKFGSTSISVHNKLGNDFKKNESRELRPEDKNFLSWVDEQFAEMTGRPIEDFSKYNEEDYFDTDTSDYYPFCRIDYDNNNKFEAIEIYSDQETELIINAKNYSDFNLQNFLALADDFVSQENNTAYTSCTKQIGIWCPDGNDRVECILFGRKGYFNN